jgi:glutamate N-acetyltransferase/amino-acid N-acetyltransferase
MNIPQGFLLSGIHSGIKKEGNDLGLIYCKGLAKAVGFFTVNANPSYSVVLCRENINNSIKALLVNSGNANCFSHKSGIKDTKTVIYNLAKLLQVKPVNILIASTGIIGKRLPVEKVINGLPHLMENLGAKPADFASSITTTDTFNKIVSESLCLEKGRANILGFAKGAGMICPNMATLLVFILTDVDLAMPAFKKVAKEAVEESFNSITVDGCMSTNDTIVFLSSSRTALTGKKEQDEFARKIKSVCLELAKMVVHDGEGASKFIEIEIKNAQTKAQAKRAAFFIANSNLMKTAIYGANPNWGRIIAALGHADVKLKEGKYRICMSDLNKKEIKISIDLKQGIFGYKVYTSDLTPEYIKINADYS